VNDPVDVDRCHRAGVDVIITDRPLAARTRLGL
jgi:glycerophosphoryl diester phosphodiesterase